MQEDIHSSSYIDHRETISFDEVSLFTFWLARGTHKTAPYMLELEMRHFGFT